MSDNYADIIIDISAEKLDRTFQYRVPEALADKVYPGSLVSVPFGRGDRVINGYVVRITDEPEFDPERTKEILDVANDNKDVPVGNLLILAAWMKHRYGGTLMQSLKVVLPKKTVVRPVERKTVSLIADEATVEKYLKEFEDKHQVARLRLLAALQEADSMDRALILQKLNVTSQVIKALENRGLVKTETSVEYRNPLVSGIYKKKMPTLTMDQRRVVDGVLSAREKGDMRPVLIHGVTGSGKTEVYMEIIDGIVKEGHQAIMLIPEISLTYQTVMRFTARFGNRVSFIHSKLSQGERYDQFLRAKNGDIDVMIGPRSALFTPFPNLGVIVMDEEHETSYKSEQMPRYSTRDTAAKLASITGASFVMGSATPSVEAYYRAESGEYTLQELPERITGGQLPVVYTVDMRSELASGNKSIFSEKLASLITNRLERGEQIMLFINRRGFSSFVSCRKCGYVYKCPHCDVSLSLHKDKKLHCHYCGYVSPMKGLCPSCGSKYIGGMRAGTEQVETLVKQAFPDAKTLRMDADTTSAKGEYERILSSFANEEADILIGTQMIVKGHDFPKVTLMGILAADMSLYAGDYRAAERTFELLTQAAGRAGRSGIPGEVVIQTYSPDNYAVISASRQDYHRFYDEETAYRVAGGYPPCAHLLQVQTEDKDEERAGRSASDIAELARTFAKGNKYAMQIIGPADASIAKIKDVYRKVVYIKCEDYEQLALLKDSIENDRASRGDFASRVEFDFDP